MKIRLHTIRDDLKPALRRASLLVALLAALCVWVPPAGGIQAVEEEEDGNFPAFLKEPIPVSMLAGNPFLPLPSERVRLPDNTGQVQEQRPPVSDSVVQEEKVKVASMVVSSIVRCMGSSSSSSSSCVVDGKLLFLGAEYKGLVLKDIGEDFVIFAGESGEHRAKITPIMFKKKTKVVDSN